MASVTKIHLWIGSVDYSEKYFWQYFTQPKKHPEFCQDGGLSWLDQDFMGYFYTQDKVEIYSVIEQTPEPAEYENIWQQCHLTGITQANAMFYYWGNDSININSKQRYHELYYMGAFDWL